MYNEQLEQLIDAALADGELTEKEKQILFKKAQAMGVDLDEFEMVLDARLVKLKKAEAEKAASSAPKSNKLGDVKKCPACGAMVQSYQGICPECGYAFEGVDANSAVKELSSLLQKESDPKKMERIIDSYPIPMDKASLLSFVTWLRPQSLDINHPLANAYYKKYTECINKIRVSFANDKQLSPFISYWDEDKKTIQKQKWINGTIKNKSFLIGVAIFIILFIFSYFMHTIILHNSVERCSVAIEKALKKGDTQKAIELYLRFNQKSSKKIPLIDKGAAISIVKACLAEDNYEEAYWVWHDAAAYEKPYKAGKVELYEYCFNHGDLEKAKIFKSSNYKYIKDVCTYLCENGKIDEAQRYLTAHKEEIKKYADKPMSEECKEAIRNIQNIINSYK